MRAPSAAVAAAVPLDDEQAFAEWVTPHVAAMASPSPGTNASHPDFGLAMLTGIEVPSPGCWQITGRFGDASLSYVVLVTGE